INAATAFHRNKLNVSFAVVPSLKEGNQDSGFLKRKYDNWSGAYDLTTLGKISDFVSIMTYDEHLEGTSPGPYAGLTWVDAVVQHARKHIPANKISLGIPTYSGYWYTGGRSRISVRTADIGYDDVKK